jgi:presenilin-like A22 family membrane protease
MHHPIGVIWPITIIIFLIVVMVTKRPHDTWMKVGMAVLFASMGVRSVYGMAHESVPVAIFFAVTLVLVAAWRTWRATKGWSEWWDEL